MTGFQRMKNDKIEVIPFFYYIIQTTKIQGFTHILGGRIFMIKREAESWLKEECSQNR